MSYKKKTIRRIKNYVHRPGKIERISFLPGLLCKEFKIYNMIKPVTNFLYGGEGR
jgi:hypothetical protein